MDSVTQNPSTKVEQTVSTHHFIYGTAWKKEETSNLVRKALEAGFTWFDTAAQPKHYREDLVGDAIRKYILDGKAKRSDLHIQTKFSRPPVQDPSNTPYPMDATLEDQIHASIKSSLRNLRHSDEQLTVVDTHDVNSYIDTLLLHSPYPTFQETLSAWRVFESYVPHRIRALGISNVSYKIITQLYAAAEVKPKFVQLRFHLETKFVVPLRRFCAEKDVVFQAHKVLKGNPGLVASKDMGAVAEAVGVNRQVALYLCIMGLDETYIVNGTKSEAHMREDLEGWQKWRKWYETSCNRQVWEKYMESFKTLIGQQGHIKE